MCDFKFLNEDDLNELLKDDEIFLSLSDTHPAIPSKNYVPEYQFNICLQNKSQTLVGECSLRIDNTELTRYPGNIGYSILEEFRGHHYSLKAVKLLFNLARKHNLKYVIINCTPENHASNRICQLAGGKFIETVEIPKEHEMYQQGYAMVNIYKIDLKN